MALRFARCSIAALALALASGCVISRHATSPEFAGVVVDNQTGAPLASVVVSLKTAERTERVAETSSDGKFRIAPRKKMVVEIPFGDRFVSGSFLFEKDGYESARVSFGGTHEPGPTPAGPVTIRMKQFGTR